MMWIEDGYLKKVSIDFVIAQLRKRGEDAIKAGILDRHDILIKGKDIKIKVKFSKPKQRSRCISPRWEFTKIIHRNRLWPVDVFDFYILVGFNKNSRVEKIWKISVDDSIIYRKNQLFISIDRCDEYKKYDLDIL